MGNGGAAEEVSREVNVRIEFIKAWGHPTRNEVYGPGNRARVSRWIADNLISGGYAIELKDVAK